MTSFMIPNSFLGYTNTNIFFLSSLSLPSNPFPVDEKSREREERNRKKEERNRKREEEKESHWYKLAVMKQLLLELPIVLLSIAMTHSVSGRGRSDERERGSDEGEGVMRERRWN